METAARQQAKTPEFTPEYAGRFYKETRERLERYNEMKRLKLGEPLGKQEGARNLSQEDTIRFELNELNKLIIADFWQYCLDEKVFEKIIEDKNHISEDNAKLLSDSDQFAEKLIQQIEEDLASQLRVYLETRINGDPIIPILKRHSEIMSVPIELDGVQKIGTTSVSEIKAGFSTAIQFIFRMSRFIPRIYLNQRGEEIKPETYMAILKNILPLFEILARNNIDTHSSINSIIWQDANFYLKEFQSQTTMDLTDIFFEKLEKQIDSDKWIPSTTTISTDCPALHAISEDGKNVIAEFYVFCQKFIQKFLLPHLDRYNLFLIKESEKASKAKRGLKY